MLIKVRFFKCGILQCNVVLNEGDIVTIWIDPKRVFLVKLAKGKRLDTDKGYILHDDIIGKEYGDVLKLSRATAYLLRPILEDIYLDLKRPSQVLYPKDVAYMIYSSSVEPGSVVIEAGTGSGFLAISLAHFLGKEGKVITYDVRRDMQETAKFNASVLNLQDRIEFKLKDIREGFEEKGVDAVFLDMPSPWEVVEKAYEALKPSAALIVFVPTVNQVEKTYLEMENKGFVEIHAEELILREYKVKEGATRPKNVGITHTGYIIRGRKSIKTS